LNRAYENLPTPDLTPREAYQRIVSNDVEAVPVDKIAHRTAANGVMPYPPGIPMLMSGENFGAEDSPQIGYLRGLEAWDRQFPGFEHVTEGAEIVAGTYHVLCIR
jgi:arginine decarboxylase